MTAWRDERERQPVEPPGVEATPPAGANGPTPRPRKRAPDASKPAMKEWLRPIVDEARERHKRRPASPGVRIEPGQNGSYRLGAAHRDLEAWEVQLCDAFGTRSGGVMWTFLDQLADLCGSQWSAEGEYWKPSEQELNAALSIVNGIRPKNEMEAALAAQMVAVHFMQMKMAAHALRGAYPDHRSASVAGKLARTFSLQMDTLGKARGKVGRQTIKVKYERHNHQHVHMHGDARTDRGVVDLEGQPVAARNRNGPDVRAGKALPAPIPDISPARELGDSSTLRSQDTLRRVVPFSRGQGQG